MARKSARTSIPAGGGLASRILNVIASRETDRDWGFTHAEAAGLVSAANVPTARDLRENWWAIQDQGQTGACVGFATADSVLRWHFVKAGRLGANEMLSPRFIWMSAKEMDEFTGTPTTFVESAGTSLKTALDIARKFGVVKDNVLPFASGTLYQGEERTLYMLASQYKILNYVNLGRDPKQWRAWLAMNGPILTRLDVDDAWMNAKATKGVLKKYVKPSQPAGHAVAMVGYDANRFIIRNSWGATAWGDKGYAYTSNAYAAAAFTEAYGVQVG